MEHVHCAPIAGVIFAIDVVEGEQVTTGKIVVEIEAETPINVVPAKRSASRDP
jgi:geranyl-CoA carboxylase alpha subunit